MSRGRSGDRSYKKDIPETKLHALQRIIDHPRETSVQDRRVAPSQAEMQRAISNGECPFCGRGYRNIAGHSWRSHGVSADELKEMAGIPRTKPVCSAEMSETYRERRKRQMREDPDLVKRLRPKGNGRDYSKAGIAVQREKLELARAAQIEATGRSLPEWLAEHNRELYLARTAERDAAIAARFQAGATLGDILAEFGIGNADTVRRALARHGIDAPDFRSRASRRAADDDWRERMQAGQRERIAVIRQRKLDRWAELGKTYEATIIMADEYGEQARAIRHFLRQNGEVVPDGRLVSPLRDRAGRADRLARWAQLGKTYDALNTLAQEWGMTRQEVKAYLRKHGEQQLPDGRAVANQARARKGYPIGAQ